jgi:uncharacterized protein (TIGR00369 family)
MKVPPDVWKDTFGHRLGMQFVKAEPGHAVATLLVKPEHCNPPGVCHGGAIFTLADDSMGGAIHPICPEGTVPTATQVNVHYARSARPGDTLTTETQVVSHGKRTAVVEARVSDGEGRLVALLTSTFLFVEARYVDPDELFGG